MSQVEYFHVFESILYGAIITQLIYGWSQLILKKGQYEPYWGHVLYTVSFFLVSVHDYFDNQNFESYLLVENSLTFLLYIALPPALISLIVYIIIPGKIEGLNFREHLVKFRVHIGIAVTIMLVNNILIQTLRDGFGPEDWIPQSVLIVLYVLFALTKNLRFLELISIVVTLVIASFLYSG